MLDQRRRRWANIDPTLDRCHVIDMTINISPVSYVVHPSMGVSPNEKYMLNQCWVGVADGGSALSRHWGNLW